LTLVSKEDDMQKHRFTQSVLALVALFALIFCQGTWVLAGTTGSITGTVTDKATNAPIAGIRVTASSPSQDATTTSDATGHFTFLSLAPDTYTISIEKAGYDQFSQSGITVQSDQSQRLTLSTNKTLRTIARTTSRSSGSLVKSGVTSDVYNITPAQQAAAAPLGGGNNLNSAYSAIQSAPGVLVPISDSGGWGQSINIRGGDYTQTGNEVDGIPINRQFDQYAGSPLSNIGNAEVQVYTGNQPVDAQANGLAGFVNQVIRTGTYPSFGDAQFGVGAPGYYHKFSVEYGGATTNRNFTYYLGFLGYNQQNRFVDQYNGAKYVPAYGSLINYVASGCTTLHPSAGCYANGAGAIGPGNGLFGGLPLGPNGYVLEPGFFGAIPSIADREGVANIHVAVPHAHDGLKDDIQVLYNSGETYNTPNDALSDFGPALGDVTNGTAFGGTIPNDGGAVCPSNTGAFAPAGTAVACAAPVGPVYLNQTVYTGPRYGALTSANLRQTNNLFFPGSNTSLGILDGAVPNNQRDGETTGFALSKVQYQHNFSSNAYARLYGYTSYSDRIDNGIVGTFQNYVGAFPSDYLISAHTRGVVAEFADQIDPHNLISFDTAYSYTNSSRFNNAVGAELPVAYLVSSANPTAGCYNATGTLAECGNFHPGVSVPRGSTYVPMLGGGLVPGPHGSPTLGALPASCGGASCEYYVVGTGAGGLRNVVRPAFTNAAISDTIKPTDKLTIQASLRFEDFTYNLAQTNNPGNQLLVNDYNANHCVAGTTVTTTASPGAACLAGTSHTALSAASPLREDYAHVYSPRVGLTYSVDPNTVIRASYGRFTQPAETAAVDSTSLQPAAPSAQFYANFGFPSYARNVEPEISYNADFSLEHALPRAGLQFSVSPFYRKTTNEFATILINPQTNFVATINGLNRQTEGAELAVSAGNFSRDGFAAQLAYTYTHSTAKFKVFPNGGSFVAAANAGIQGYNGYTKYCATNPTAKLCGATESGAVAAPCYTPAAGTAAAAAAPGCGPGTVANPYWNSQPFGLLDPNASYVPFNINLGTGFGGGATSYVVPHVASLILQYKKGPLTISPSLQFQGGSRYGSPLAAQGIAPDTCGVLPGSGTSVAGDPRYTNGSPGAGQPYDASSCLGVVPIPNPQTKHFDGIGEYVQPNLIATNLSLNYDFNKQVGLNVIAANIFNRCFGGSSVPWQVAKISCAYGQAGNYVGNFYNPGDPIQANVNQSYQPVLGGALQSVSAGSPLPFELYVNLNVRM